MVYLKRARALLGVAIIIAGSFIIIRPWLNAWYFDFMQARIIQTWLDEDLYGWSGGPREPAWTTATITIGDTRPNNNIWDENINPTMDLMHLASITDGILTIDRINLRVPILNEYTGRNLDISINSVNPRVRMGDTGNYVLTGHASRIFGRHFNRLRELSPGDKIVVENKSERFEYIVYDSFSVTASDVWVMDRDGDRSIITLITCDHRTNPVGRLIVRGELVS